jgi:hypothetical protein
LPSFLPSSYWRTSFFCWFVFISVFEVSVIMSLFIFKISFLLGLTISIPASCY